MKYELKTITPVHVGTGERLNQIDGFFDDGRWHRIDVDAVLASFSESELNRLTIAMGQRDFQWRNHLPPNSSFARYTLPCPEAPRDTEIREAMKTPSCRPIIPGSGIKGAVRTALLWGFIDDDDPEAKEAFADSVNDLKGQLQRRLNRSSAGQQIERRVLGKNPNHDLMRVVQVSDTAAIPIEALELGVAWTVTLDRDGNLVQKKEGNREYKTFVEQIRAEQTLEFSIKIDKSLFGQREKHELGYSERQERGVCEELAEVCNFVAKDLANAEAAFFYKYSLDEISNFYDALLERIANLPDGGFVLPIGWGTGYRAKTVTELLTNTELLAEDDAGLMMDLREHYRLGRSRSQRDYYHPEFPKTRRVLYDRQSPKSPLGWVQITPKT